jgi:hypothetical protein
VALVLLAAVSAGTVAVVTVGALARAALRRAAQASAAPQAPPAPRQRASTPPGLSLWAVGESVKVQPSSSLGPPLAAGGSVRLLAARGETAAFQLVLAAPADTPTVEIELGELAGAAGTLPKRSLSAFLETFLQCPAVESKLVALPAGEFPDPLVPLWEAGPGSASIAHPFPLHAERNQVLWIDVAVPRSAAAGVYLGQLGVLASGYPPAGVMIELEVLPFEIPARPSLPAWVPLYATRLYEREGLEALSPAARLRTIWSYFRLAQEHRFSTQIIEHQPKVSWDEKTGALRSIDWADFDALNGPALDGSLFEDREPPRVFKVGGFVWWGARPGDPPNFGGDYRRDHRLTAAHERALGEYTTAFARHFQERGYTRTEPFMYMIDEPKFREYPGTPALVRAYGEAIRSAKTGIRHLVTIAPHESPVPVGGVDTWATWGAGYRPAEMQARQALGEKAWIYQQHEPFVGGHCLNNEGLGLRTWSWIAWRYAVDGLFLWVGNFWDEDPYRSVFNWDDGLLGNGILFYPGARLPQAGFRSVPGAVPSYRMKAFRRGLFDYEYFSLLKQRGGDPDAVVRRVMRSALNEKGYDPYWNHPRWAKPGDWSHEPADWDAARAELGRAIVARSP